MRRHPKCAVLPASALARLRILFLARHACGDGRAHATDGNHATYHHELRTTLERIGLNVTAADSFDAIARCPEADFVIPLLNRGGFTNSEMLAPLLLAQHGVPYLGASPILRGLADDKHLAKLAARHHDIPTPAWRIHRRGAGPIERPRPAVDRMVVKPNASSASWGVRIIDDWADAIQHIGWLHDNGHDAIVEDYAPLLDIAVPVIGGASPDPWLLPPMAYVPDDPHRLRSYEEKRALVDTDIDPLVPITDPAVIAQLDGYTRALARELWPFDYGRFEYRYDPHSGAVQFMEVNLSCNLWSQKTISRSAASIGIDHATLVESIVAHSLARQGVTTATLAEMAA